MPRVEKTKHQTKPIKKRPVRKMQDFQTYVMWRSLPGILKGKSISEMNALGIDDPITVELLTLKNQTEFATKYKVAQETLSDWNKKIEEDNLIKDSIGFWLKKLTPNVMISIYRQIMKQGNAAEVKLWLQFVEQWQESQQMNVHSQALEDLTNSVKTWLES